MAGRIVDSRSWIVGERTMEAASPTTTRPGQPAQHYRTKTMTRHPLLPLSLLAALLIGVLSLGGCVSQPTPSEPPAPPPPDTMMLVKKGSRFTYLEEIYEQGKRQDDRTRRIAWLASKAGIDSAHTDSTLWKATIADDSVGPRTIDASVPMTILYRKNGDVVMQRYFSSYVDPGFVDMVIPLSVHADIELPYHYSIQEFRQDNHQYTYSSFTRTTTCRYLGRDTIDAAGERMACEHGEVVIMTYGASGWGNYPIPSPDSASYDTYAVEYWFAPKIGFIAKEKVYWTNVRNVAESPYWVERTLQSYELQ
jgi:hypothetical protein